MATALPLRGAIRHGALLTLANWPVVLVDFLVETLFKFTVAVPIVGAAFMAATLFGYDIRDLLDDGVWSAANELLLSLESAPVALVTFVLALGAAGAGGGALMYVVKNGTLAMLVAAEAQARDLHHGPARIGGLRGASAFRMAGVIDAAHRYRRRSVSLALMLAGAYGILGLGYFTVVTYGLRWAAASSLSAAFPVLVLLATSAGLVATAAVNLLFDLTRVVMVTDDCAPREAMARVRRFLVEDARHVLGVYGIMLMVSALGVALSLTATAWLTLVAWVPVAGLLMVPLQGLFWVIRGVLFQYLSLAALAAYQTQYRRFTRPAAPTIPFLRQEA